MGVRREGREAAVQFLYQKDLGGDEERIAYYKMRGISPSARRFCDEILDGLAASAEAVDGLIRENARNYEFNRLSAVDRNVLRVAVWEMMNCPGTPPAVSINEAIEVAKKYSTSDSGRFVNGVLDKIRTGLQRPPRAKVD